MVEFAARLRKRLQGFDPVAAATLRAYSWPGNVRELRNAIERAVLLAQGPLLRAQDLPEEILKVCPPSLHPPAGILPSPYSQYVAPPSDPSLPAKIALPPGATERIPGEDEILTLEEEEKRIFQRALRLTKGDVSEAASKLGIGRATLYRRIKELNLDSGRMEAV
jgi:two-component system nitrogen regulation response regulator GlnG